MIIMTTKESLAKHVTRIILDCVLKLNEFYYNDNHCKYSNLLRLYRILKTQKIFTQLSVHLKAVRTPDFSEKLFLQNKKQFPRTFPQNFSAEFFK